MARIPDSQLNQIKEWYFDKKMSIFDISAKLGVTYKTTLYFMIKNGVARRSSSEESARRFAAKLPSFALKTCRTEALRQLKTIGMVLYWGEGYKAIGGSSVDFANSDPEMVSMFLRFLREVCGVKESKMRVLLYCYANQDLLELIRFWSKITRIPKSQFTKPYIRSDFRSEKIDKMPHGLVHIRYGDKKLRMLIIEWIKDLTK